MIYTGQFQNDKRHGYGHCKWRDGTVYFGEFKENKIEGYGL